MHINDFQSILPDNSITIPLKDQTGITVIETSQGSNKAYILNKDGSIRWDISTLLQTTYDNPQNRYIHFLDVYYIREDLYFFINTGDTYDYRFTFNPNTGQMGTLIPSK